MKILKFTAENVKKLRVVEITPTGDVVEITGKNGQGKTTVLDAIWWALAGTKHIQAVPIRNGADKARIRLDLGELIVERRFTPKGSTLTVEKADGARYTSPQSILDELLGALTFDPLAFAHAEPDEQFETLRAIVPLEVDVDQLDALNRGDFDRRTDLNREAKAKHAQADGIVVPAERLPDAPIDTAALKDQMAEASRINSELQVRRERREQAARDAQGYRAAAAEKQARAEKLRQEAQQLEDAALGLVHRAAGLDEKLAVADPLPDPVDVNALRAELDAAESMNRQLERVVKKAELIAEAKQLEAQARQLTETMAAREQTKADAIAKAPMPVAGLGFGAGLVTFNGLPFDQASDAEQLRVSVAIAMAANPKLRVLRIKEGSLLDEDSLAMIGQLAREREYQVWIERVDSSGKIGVVLEDGQVKAVNA